MPKVKTHRGAAKRFSLTGSGKVKRSKAFKGHLLTKKSAKRKRSLKGEAFVSLVEQKNIKKLIPYM